jgi:glycosyltransferase involved in cell wall biosynthesis
MNRDGVDLVEGMVSVVIPTYMRADKVREAAESALAQDVEPLEVIIVDDNRDQAWRSATEAAVGEILGDRLVFVRNQRSPGGCGARNTGIEAAKGEFIAFLDDDDKLLPGGLKAQRDALEANPHAALAFGVAVIVDEVYGRSWDYGVRAGVYEGKDLLLGKCPSTSSIVIARKSALVDGGLFDEAMQSFQDLDMWLRVAQHGQLLAHKTKVARFVQHGGLRTSVDIEKRIAGLDRMVGKWGGMLPDSISAEELRARFLSMMYLQNGRLFLAKGLRYRVSALKYIWQSFSVARERRGRALARFLASLWGFRANQFFALVIGRWRSRARD